MNINASEWVPTTTGGSTSSSPSVPLTAPPSEWKPTVSSSSTAEYGQGMRELCHSSPSYSPTWNQVGGAAPGGGEWDWAAEFEKVLTLTEQMLRQQEEEEVAASGGGRPSTGAATASGSGANQTPPTTVHTQIAAAAAAKTPASQPPPSSPPLAPPQQPPQSSSGGDRTWAEQLAARSSSADEVSPAKTAAATKTPKQWTSDDGKPIPPLTVNGNHRWKKPTKGQRMKELAQRTAFESFAKALLHSASPFTTPLRHVTHTSLPHIKVDQRFGKPGQPQSAVAQFIVAPLVTNYRPRHFHDVTPGDLMEFHYDFSHVLKALPSAYTIVVGYGPTWKRFAVPYAYIACRNYREEVLRLCPNEVPNSRCEPHYEDDLMKDITEVVLAVEGLEALQDFSLVEAMRRRINLAPLYDVFQSVFECLENYQIEIWHLNSAPPTFVLKTNRSQVEAMGPIELLGRPQLWDQLPVVTRESLKQRCTVWNPITSRPQSKVAGAAGVSASIAGSSHASTAHAGADLSGRLPPKKKANHPPSAHGSEMHAAERDMIPTALVLAPIFISALVVASTIAVLLKKRR